jgi:hypothetical protein
LDLAIELLRDDLRSKSGDGEAGLEVMEAEELSQNSGREDAAFVLSIAGGSRAEGCENEEALFAGGYCKRCKRPRGGRTKAARVYDSLPDQDALLTGGWGGGIFSLDLIAKLPYCESARIEFREVVVRQPSANRFLELIGPPRAPFAALPGGPGRWHFTCPKCKVSSSPMYMPYEADYFHFVAREMLPDPLPAVFVVGNAALLSLCISRGLWRGLFGKCVGVESSKIGFL